MTGTSVVEKARSMEEKSRELLTSGKLRRGEVENLKMQYENQLQYADFLRFNLAELGQNITLIATRLSDMKTKNGEWSLKRVELFFFPQNSWCDLTKFLF